MKVLFPYNNWIGGLMSSFERAFRCKGFETFSSKTPKSNGFFDNKYMNQVKYFSNLNTKKFNEQHNANFISEAKKIKPDFIFTQSGGGLFPETLAYLKNDLKVRTISVVSDNPFDAWRDKYFGLTLPFYDYLLVPERIWIQNICNVAPSAEIIFFIGGYDQEQFFLVDENTLTPYDKSRFNCDLSFTGGSYGDLGEGNYRAGLLSQLGGYKLKIWGDRGWAKRGEKYTALKNAYQGDRLSYEDLRKLYYISKINLNIPSPMILTSFQPRVFDIAISKGFQIVDYRSELANFFRDDEIVSFKNFNDLKDKIDYYLDHEVERRNIAENLYGKVENEYSLSNQVDIVMKEILK